MKNIGTLLLAILVFWITTIAMFNPNAIGLTTIGTSGIATYSNSTGILNIPNYQTNGKRQETYSGTTNGSGVLTVTFSQAYSVAPNIQVSIPAQSATNQYIRVSAVSTTGCTINAFAFNSNNLLGIISLLTTTSNVGSLGVDVLVTEK